MTAAVDAIGNVVGRYEGARPGAKAVLLGSHLDSVRDAGRYDGTLGVVAAIACVDALRRARRRLPVAIEVVGFGDEEGVRFGADAARQPRADRAVRPRTAGAHRRRRHHHGATRCGGSGSTRRASATAARRRGGVRRLSGTAHRAGAGAGARAAAGRRASPRSPGRRGCAVTLTGMAGHAGTVPMALRHDALAAAAEAVLAVERRCAGGGRLGRHGRPDRGAARRGQRDRRARDVQRRSARAAGRAARAAVAATCATPWPASPRGAACGSRSR